VPGADRVAAALRRAHPDLVYLNTGRTAATIDTVRTTQLRTVLDFQPDLVHITCGGNDLFLPDTGLDAVETNLDDLFGAVRACGARLSTLTLADAYPDRLREYRPRFAAFAGIVRRVAARHDAVLTELWDHPARLRPNWLSADRIHLTMAGHAVVAAEVIRALGRFAAE
jgi:lysophospholipase L1-like esterase